jgi:hypothetical protein
MAYLYSKPSSVDDAKYARDIPLGTKRRAMSGDLEGGKIQVEGTIFDRSGIALHEDKSSSLPTPVTATFPSTRPKSRSSPNPSPEPSKVPALSVRRTKFKPKEIFFIPIWIILGLSVIIYNNYIWHTLKFKSALFLLTWQFLFASIGTRILARTTHVFDGAKATDLTTSHFIIWIIFTTTLSVISLTWSHLNYTELSAGYIQILEVCRAWTSIRVLPAIVDMPLGIESTNRPLFLFCNEDRKESFSQDFHNSLNN